MARTINMHTDLQISSCWEQIKGTVVLKSPFERIFNVMQLILVKIKWHIKWKYLIQKFHDNCLSYYIKNGHVWMHSLLVTTIASEGVIFV
jgi:hypothetical protein